MRGSKTNNCGAAPKFWFKTVLKTTTVYAIYSVCVMDWNWLLRSAEDAWITDTHAHKHFRCVTHGRHHRAPRETTSCMRVRRRPGYRVGSYQNLNSGNLLMNGRNSSFCLVGREGPSSAGETGLNTLSTQWLFKARFTLQVKTNQILIEIISCNWGIGMWRI